MEKVTIVSKYPEIVEQCQNQHIPLNQVFAKISKTADGTTEVGYPLVSLNASHHIVTDTDGNVMYDAGRLHSAESFSTQHAKELGQHFESVKAAIAKAKASGHIEADGGHAASGHEATGHEHAAV